MQAKRLLNTFEAHGVACTEINALLPQSLQIPSISWSTAEHLSGALRQGHIDWANHFFDLDPGWLAGRSQGAHRAIDSYKAPEKLHEWFEAQGVQNYNRFKLYFATSSPTAFDQHTRGVFSVVLEEFFEVSDETHSRYYLLSEGAGFDHPPCVLHLIQIMAIAHHHRVIMRRCFLAEKDLHPLVSGEGLIPHWLFKNRGTTLNADHEFWSHFSGKPAWLEERRTECDASLIAAGLRNIVETVQRDRSRFGRG
tara:strand:+ start:209 stop:964 length:756 start_codon:yes stop_codon:yes gene_type:complete